MPKHRESPLRRVNPSGRVVWVARYTTPDGRRVSAGTFRLQREAQDAIDAAYDAPRVPTTVGEYARTWTTRHPRAERTNRTNDHRVSRVLDARLEGRRLKDWPLAQLRRRQAIDLLDILFREQGRSASGAANIIRALSAMLEDAISDEVAGSNPFRGLRIRQADPRAVKPPREPRVWSWEQMHQFAAKAAEHQAMLRMLADCGLRVGELLALRRDLQDLKAGVFTVKGTAWNGQLVQSSRRKNHDRQGPIPPGCLQLLRAMPARIDSPWLFPTPTGRLWRLDNYYRDVWRPTRKRAGIDPTPQEFRHSYVTHLRAAGVDPADLAEIAGHTVETATARYTHPLRRSFDEVKRLVG